MSQSNIAILGAGKLGIVIAQLALKAGYTVYLSGSSNPAKIRLTAKVLAPGSIVSTSEDAIALADLVVLALPLGRYKQLPKAALAGKIVIDAMNYWREVDGERQELTDPRMSSSQLVQRHLNDSIVVKALSHIGYHDLRDESRPEGSVDRKAVAIAGDTKSAVDMVAKFVNTLGFDPVRIGALAEGIKLQPSGPVFGAHVNKTELIHLLEEFNRSELGISIASSKH